MDPILDLKAFIAHYEREQDEWEFRMVFLTPGYKTFLELLMEGRFNGSVLPIGCHCKCQPELHEHYIIKFPKGMNYNSQRTASQALYRRRGIDWPKKFTCAPVQTNTSALMNRILYILGTESRNYVPSQGRRKMIAGAHEYQQHPFSRLPTMGELHAVRKEIREESREKMEDLNAWLDKMRAGKRRRKENLFRSNGIA
jgi:hypothetical protein